MHFLNFIEKRMFFRKIMSLLAAGIFVLQTTVPVLAQGVIGLPVPGTMVTPSAGYVPALIRGITVHPDNPLQFDFIIDTGNSELENDALKDESSRLIKYFLASLTVPEKELWVNLSPYENDRIATDAFGRTEMGRDLLGQDYILKQLTSSLIYPESDLGKEFWKKIYEKTTAKYGDISIPVNTFNKVWIVPDVASVYEYKNSAVIMKSHLKVMLEQDYVALTHDPKLKAAVEKSQLGQSKEVNELGSQVVREIVIPEIEKEVNEGKNFATLRQIYHSMILAAWFKNNLKQSLLGQVYVDKNKVLGVDTDDPQVKQKIYEQYLEAFKKGVYNYIREDEDPVTHDVVPRKYFSGGFMGSDLTGIAKTTRVENPPDVPRKGRIVRVSTAVVENQGKNLGAIMRQKLMAILLGGIFVFSPSVNAVTDETAAVYANNQAEYSNPITIEKAKQDIDENMNKMFAKFKKDKLAAKALAPWIWKDAHSTDKFDEFTAKVRTTLAAEANSDRRTVLQKQVLQTLYVFVRANAIFDFAGQVINEKNVGNFRNFIVRDPKYPTETRTYVCQSNSEWNLPVLVYELGFDPDAVTIVDVRVDSRGVVTDQDGGHTANMIVFANGTRTIVDITRGDNNNFGIGLPHRVIVVKGGKVVTVDPKNLSQSLQGAQGNSVEDFSKYQKYVKIFLPQLKALLKKQDDLLNAILAKDYSKALNIVNGMIEEAQRLQRDIEGTGYVLETYTPYLDEFIKTLRDNKSQLERKSPLQSSPPPSQPPASASSPGNITNDKDPNVGGINLDPALLKLQIKRDANGVPLAVSQQPIGHMDIQGFAPVILNITPVVNLPMFLSENFNAPDNAVASIVN